MVQDHRPKWQNSLQHFTTQVHYLSCSRTFFGLCPIGAWTPDHMITRLAPLHICWTPQWLPLFLEAIMDCAGTHHHEQPWLRHVSLCFFFLLVTLWQWTHVAACFPMLNFIYFSELYDWRIRSLKSPLQTTLSRVTIRRLAIWIYLRSGTTALLLQPAIRAIFLLIMADFWTAVSPVAKPHTITFVSEPRGILALCSVKRCPVLYPLKDQV